MISIMRYLKYFWVQQWGENRGWHRCVTFDEFVQFRRCHLINETTRVPGLYCSPLNPELYYPSSSLSISSPSPSSPSSTYRNYEGKVWGLSPLWSDPHWTTLCTMLILSILDHPQEFNIAAKQRLKGIYPIYSLFCQPRSHFFAFLDTFHPPPPPV